MRLFCKYHIRNKFAPSPYLKKAYNFATHWQPVASRHLQSSSGCKDICEVSSLHACKDSKDGRFWKSQHLCTQICIMGKFDFSSRERRAGFHSGKFFCRSNGEQSIFRYCCGDPITKESIHSVENLFWVKTDHKDVICNEVMHVNLKPKTIVFVHLAYFINQTV